MTDSLSSCSVISHLLITQAQGPYISQGALFQISMQSTSQAAGSVAGLCRLLAPIFWQVHEILLAIFQEPAHLLQLEGIGGFTGPTEGLGVRGLHNHVGHSASTKEHENGHQLPR